MPLSTGPDKTTADRRVTFMRSALPPLAVSWAIWRWLCRVGSVSAANFFKSSSRPLLASF